MHEMREEGKSLIKLIRTRHFIERQKPVKIKQVFKLGGIYAG